MTEKQLLIKRMEFELPITLKVLRAISADAFNFKPHERSATVKENLQIMISEIGAIPNALTGKENLFNPVAVASLEEGISSYESEYGKALEIVKQTPDEDFDKPLIGMMGNFFPIRSDGAWMFFSDGIHHRGQLSVYIRMTGGKVPSIYGPSADDNPFQ